jgi:hypothetical protein
MASSYTVENRGDSIVRSASGTIVASATATDVFISLGWVPKRFVLIGIVNLLKQEWIAGMNQGDFFENAAAGDRTLETDDQLVVGAVGDVGDGQVAAPAEGEVMILTGGGILDDNDGAVWYAEG